MANTKESLEGLLPYCTPRQKELVIAWMETGAGGKAAKKLGIGERRARTMLAIVKKKAAEKGWHQDKSLSHQTREGFSIDKTSELVDAQTGETRLVWYKTSKEKEDQMATMKAVVDELKSEIKPTKRIPLKNKKHNSNLLNLYVLTDYHLAGLAWAEETGDDWDLSIARDLMINSFKYLIEAAPQAEVGYFCELGDFQEYDSMDSVTPTNKHLLDSDGRPTKMIRIAIQVMREVISMMAQKYKKVVVLAAEGNHNEYSSIWMREMLSAFYEKNPRIEVVTTVKPYYAYEWGVNMLGFHHGHKKNTSNVGEVFMSEYREMFGRTKLLHIHTGHYHKRDITEKNTHLVEIHPTLTGRNAYAARGGWFSERAMQVITYHKDYKETSRNLFKPEMLL